MCIGNVTTITAGLGWKLWVWVWRLPEGSGRYCCNVINVVVRWQSRLRYRSEMGAKSDVNEFGLISKSICYFRHTDGGVLYCHYLLFVSVLLFFNPVRGRGSWSICFSCICLFIMHASISVLFVFLLVSGIDCVGVRN